MSFVLGMVAAFGAVAYVAWLAVAAVNSFGNTSQHIGAPPTVPAAAPPGASPLHDARSAAATPVAGFPGPATPSGTTLPFDQLWIAGDGNTIVVGAPMVGISPTTGESMIQVPVTLTNNGQRAWNLESTSFTGMLNHAPVAESTDGDWMYRVPIAPHTSVTLNKIFVGHPGQFTLKINTPQDKAVFTGRI